MTTLIHEAEAPTLNERDHRTTTHGSGDVPRARGWSAHATEHEDVQPDLEAALTAARAGDEQGFAEIWRALHPPLLRYLRVRGDDAPEDLAAETWMHVVRSLRQFEGELVDFRRWLFTIARHRAVDQARARARRPRVVAPLEDTATAPDTMPSVPSAEAQVVEGEATERALRLLDTLPPAQAEMVALRFVADLDVADVAQLVGKKPGTVRVAVHGALRTLARDPRALAAREVV